ncbi:Uncharacterised protein [Urinicoccus massiliensis]|uniref:Uncharacterized protein n=1 Tax=Urinicoccus massiliensis TaxID=1723382 RepID=A0A8H2MA49_9FIRM|nr:hypothetical protein [Urinicoccus massiliensis]VFB17070.1 Uncharacterised protein [Urinicoccus massiliensis]
MKFMDLKLQEELKKNQPRVFQYFSQKTKALLTMIFTCSFFSIWTINDWEEKIPGLGIGLVLLGIFLCLWQVLDFLKTTKLLTKEDWDHPLLVEEKKIKEAISVWVFFLILFFYGAYLIYQCLGF